MQQTLGKSPPKNVPLPTLAGNPTNTSERTQLAEPAPQLDLPQRIEAPEILKTPPRLVAPTRDARVRSSIFSPHAITLSKLRHDLCRSLGQDIKKIESKLSCLSASKEKNPESGASAKLVKEYTMLAASSKRAGRHDAECTAYLCLGITYDNAEEYIKAIDCYSLVLSICESTQNKIFMGLAYNSIGVDYQLMSSSNREFCYSGSFVDQNSKSLQNAVHFHTKHLEVADDAGKYVAHINLGLTLGSLGQPNEAAKHYQEALRISIRLNSSYGQALAVGNLGLLASRQNDVETATSCMDQHLQLIQAVNDRPSEVYACTQLGLLACRSGDYEKAVHYFDQGYTIAQELGENGIVKQCSCYLGLARGRLQMEAYVKQIVGPLT